MGDPAGRQAPQVVARGARLARCADRLPLEQVVGPRIGAGRGHPAVRLDDARPAADEQQRRLRLAVGGLGEQQPGAAASAGRRPRRRGTPTRRGSGSPPGRPSRGRSGRTRASRSPSASTTVTPAGPGLVDVLAPLLAQVAPEASSSARRSMIRVAFGWIGGAGRQPAARSARAERAVVVGGPSASISGSIRTWLTRPADAGRSSRSVAGEARRSPRASSRWPPGRAGRRRIPTASVEDGGRGPARRSAARHSSAATRCAAQPLTALTAAHALVWRYEPGSLRRDEPSQSPGSTSVTT